jgi:hypothetical protein
MEDFGALGRLTTHVQNSQQRHVTDDQLDSSVKSRVAHHLDSQRD